MYVLKASLLSSEGARNRERLRSDAIPKMRLHKFLTAVLQLSERCPSYKEFSPLKSRGASQSYGFAASDSWFGNNPTSDGSSSSEWHRGP